MHEDEIDIVQLFVTLWYRRKQIVAGTVLFAFIGLIYALLASPVYHAEATFAPKESQKAGNATSLLAQMGGFGGAVFSQMGIGNTSLDRMEIIIKGRDLAETVILQNQLMPQLFPDEWDSVNNRWNGSDSLAFPKLRKGIERLRKEHLEFSVKPKNNTIIVGINTYDPELAVNWVNFYLNALNYKIQQDIIADATSNKEYLEKQLLNTTDPLVVEKLRNMIAYELERAMLVSSKSIDILEKPIIPIYRTKPKRTLILAVSIVAGFFCTVIGVLGVNIIGKFTAEIKQRTLDLRIK